MSDDLNELSKDTLDSYLSKSKFETNKMLAKTREAHAEGGILGAQKYLKDTARKYKNRVRGQTNADLKKDGLSYAPATGVKSKLHREDTSDLLDTVFSSEPSSFNELFNEIVLSKIEDHIEEYKVYLAQTMYNEEYLDELSGSKLGDYITKARKNISDRSKKGNFDHLDYKKQGNRTKGIDRAGSKLLGGRDEYGSDVKITYNKPKVKAGLTNEDTDTLDEISKAILNRYINKSEYDDKRKDSRKLALHKIWGDPKYGFEDKVRVPADGKFPSGHTGKKLTKEDINEMRRPSSIKGWSNALSDIAKMRSDKANASKTVKLHKLNKNGSESGMHDAAKMFDSSEEAHAHHENITKLNPNSKIAHNMYVDGKFVKRLG